MALLPLGAIITCKTFHTIYFFLPFLLHYQGRKFRENYFVLLLGCGVIWNLTKKIDKANVVEARRSGGKVLKKLLSRDSSVIVKIR
jgi:hypothetical protein